MRLINIIITIFVISLNSMFSQNVNLNTKYSFTFNNKYSSNEISLEALYLLENKKFELGVIIGIVNMHYNEQIWQKALNDEYKLFYGARVNFYPFEIIEHNFFPYFGFKLASVYDRTLAFGGGGMVFDQGFYFPNANDDYMVSAIMGSVIFTKSISFIFEVEYEFRSFNLKYSEYFYEEENHYLVPKRYNIKKILNSIQLSMGVHLVL